MPLRRAARASTMRWNSSAGIDNAARRSDWPRAACSPMRIAFACWLKSSDEKSPSAGSITTSVAFSVLRCSAVLCRIRMASIWLDTVATESSLPRSSSGKPQSTTMRMSTPISRATSMGRFDDRPPSTSMRPSDSTGENTPGADRLARMAVVRSPWPRIDAVAGDDVGGHGAERDGEVVEVLDLRHRQREAAQDLRELLSLDQATRQAELAALQAQRKLHQEVLVFELAAEIERAARRAVTEGVLPVDRGHDPFDVGRRESGRIQAANDRAHAGASDDIDWHVVFLEHLEHADVSRATCAAARQHQSDSRAGGFRRPALPPVRAQMRRPRGRTRQTALIFLL